MALQKLQIPISFNGGIDTKTDDKQVVATKLLELENGVFSKKGSLRKRYGNRILSSTVLSDSSTIDKSTGATTFKDQLVLFTGTELCSYIESSEAWAKKGTASSVLNTNRSIIRNVYQQTDADYSYNEGISVYVWKDSSNGCRYSVLDEESGTVIQSNQLLSSTAQKPRVIGLGRYFFVMYIEGTAVKLRTIPVVAPDTITSAQDLTTNVDGTDKFYEAFKIGSRIFISYNHNDPSGQISTFYITANKVVSNEALLPAQQITGGVSICGDSNQNVWVSWTDGTDVKYAIWDYNLDTTGGGNPTVLDVTTIETVGDVRNIASVETDSALVTFLYEITNANGNYIKKEYWNSCWQYRNSFSISTISRISIQVFFL
jgi:hypothetical protein